MDKSILKQLPAEILKKLGAEQIKKLEACKDRDGAIALLGEFGVELPDELLDGIAGGRRLKDPPPIL